MDDHRVTDVAELRRLYGTPMSRALTKVTRTFTEPQRRFIARAPFLVIGSHGPTGADVSPRGDQPGFVQLLSDTSLAVPDRVGNRRIDTLMNILSNPEVALIFFIPGLNETLRVNGSAHISTRPELLEALAHEGKPPLTAIVVEAHEIFHQCVRALRRSNLWNPDDFVDPDFPRISNTPESEYDGKLY